LNTFKISSISSISLSLACDINYSYGFITSTSGLTSRCKNFSLSKYPLINNLQEAFNIEEVNAFNDGHALGIAFLLKNLLKNKFDDFSYPKN